MIGTILTWRNNKWCEIDSAILLHTNEWRSLPLCDGVVLELQTEQARRIFQILLFSLPHGEFYLRISLRYCTISIYV